MSLKIGVKWLTRSFLILLYIQASNAYGLLQTGLSTTNVDAADLGAGSTRAGLLTTTTGIYSGSQLLIYDNVGGSFVQRQAPITLAVTQLAYPTHGRFYFGDPFDSVAVALYKDSEVLIYRNPGPRQPFDVSPSTVLTLPAKSLVIGTVAANLLGNGRADILALVTNPANPSVAYWHANGDGTFNGPFFVALPGIPTSVDSGPIFGQDVDDAAVTLGDTGEVVTLRNTGGTLAMDTRYLVGTMPTGVKIVHLNPARDPRAGDVATANMASNNITVRLNDGAGGLGERADYATGFAPIQLTAGDFAGRGLQDLAVSNESSSAVYQYMNNGNGTLLDPLIYPAGSATAGITAGSFNGNNVDSWQVATFLSGTVQATPAAATTTSLNQSSSSSAPGQSVTFTAMVASAAGTPTGNVGFSIDGGAMTVIPLNNGVASFSTSTLTSGTHTITATYLGSSTPAFDVSSATVTHVVLFPTTENLTSSVNPSFVGQSVTFTATISGPSGAPTATGTVTFLIDNVQVAAVMLDSNGRASFTTSTLSGGSHTITANYSGDSNFLPSTASLTQVVTTQTPSVGITSSVNPSTFGQRVTFTATVSGAPGSPTPTGTVNFLVDNIPATTVSLDSNGQAAFSTSSLSLGTHIITANYSGDGNYTPATTTLTQVVTQGLSTVTITASANPITQGEPVTFSVTVNGPAGSPTPSGTVTFIVDGQSTTVPLNSSGQASFTITNLAVGTHVITVNYSGDRNYAPATATFTEVVLVPIQPPSHARGEQKFNHFATQTDIANVITWRNPTSGSTPVEYRIYRNEKLTKLAKIVSGHDHHFVDHNRQKNRTYKYFIVSVDAAGNRSTASEVIVRPR